MTGEQMILKNLKENPNSPVVRGTYRTIKSWYEEEFGIAWTLKELSEARNYFGVFKGPKLFKSLETIFEAENREAANGNNKFIGTRQVTAQQFCLYAKGLYFLAAYQIFQNN
jgi:hypothetical protein